MYKKLTGRVRGLYVNTGAFELAGKGFVLILPQKTMNTKQWLKPMVCLPQFLLGDVVSLIIKVFSKKLYVYKRNLWNNI